MPGTHALRQLPEQDLSPLGRGGGAPEIPGAAAKRQPDQGRRQPGRDLVVDGKPPEHFLRRGERGDACLACGAGQGGRSQHEQGPRVCPARLPWHRQERIGERLIVPGFDEPPDSKLIHHDVGGELPVTGFGRIARCLVQAAVALVPPGRAPVQVGHVPAVLEAQLET